MAATIERLVKRYDQLLADRQLWEPWWLELGTYILPRKTGPLSGSSALGQVSVNRMPDPKISTKLFDSTAPHSNEILAASMQGTLTSSAIKWFKLKTRKQQLNDIQRVAEWLDEVADRIYLALQQSNFNSELQEVYLDLGAFGTGGMVIEELEPTAPEFSGFRFEAQQIGTYAIAENKEGRADTIFRVFSLSVHAAHDKWGERIGQKLLQIFEKTPDKYVEIVHAIYPRSSDEQGPGRGRRAGLRKPFASVYFTKEHKHKIAEGGFDSFPVLIPRWTKSSGDVYGRGPGFTALPDIKTLNKAKELTLRAWGKTIDPPLKARSDGVIGTVKTSPSSINTVMDMDALQAMEFGGKWDVGQIQTRDLRESIKQIFFTDQLQLPTGSPQMTATEVERRFELMQRILGPTLGRLETELLNPLIERTFGMLLLRGALPPPPPEIMPSRENPSGEVIDVEYEGPLARAQRGADVQAIERTIRGVEPLVASNPEVMDNLDLDETTRYIAQKNGVPPQIVRDRDKVQQMREARQAQRQKDVQAKEAEQMLAAAKGAAPLLKAISPKGLIPQESAGGTGSGA